jgi:hypothetical protein
VFIKWCCGVNAVENTISIISKQLDAISPLTDNRKPDSTRVRDCELSHPRIREIEWKSFCVKRNNDKFNLRKPNQWDKQIPQMMAIHAESNALPDPEVETASG